MLSLSGVIRAAQTLPSQTLKTGEITKPRNVLQVEGLDGRGLVQLYTLTVPDLAPYEGRVGQRIEVPVKAWAKNATVNLSYEAQA